MFELRNDLMEKQAVNIGKLLYMRFTVTYGDRFTHNHPTDEFVNCWIEEWNEGLADIEHMHIKDALQHCRLTFEWPPTLAEFRKICEQSAGIPTAEQAMQAAIRRDFYHPIIKLAYDKIGSWDMRHDTQAALLKKFKTAHQEALKTFRNTQIQNRLADNSNQRLRIVELNAL